MSYCKFLRFHLDNYLLSLIDLKILKHCPEIFEYSIERVPNEKFGQISSNILMINSKRSTLEPEELGDNLIKNFSKLKEFNHIKIIKPGFLNFEFCNEYWHYELFEMFKNKLKIDKSKFKKKRVNIEFVSANPTGLMHIGHARGAILGDTIANLLTEAGYEVDREYYINDAGNQISVLMDSIKYFYDKTTKKNVLKPKEFYPGEYIENLAKKLINKGIEINFNDNKDFLKKFIIDLILKDIKLDLKNLGVMHNIFVSEKEITTKEKVDLVIKKLKDKKLVYEGFAEKPEGKTSDNWKPEKQLLFKSELIDDDKDRTLVKPNGDLTYFMSDIIYHSKKINRSYDILLNIWGVDHSGYVKRLKNAVSALFDEKINFNIQLTSLVNLLENKKPVKMSKRKGKFITLREVIKDVGKDVIRFMMISRKADKVIDFDFDIVKQQTKDNPIFYVKYAHARCCSIETLCGSKKFSDSEITKHFDLLNLSEEIDLIIMLSNYLNILNQSINKLEPHRLTNYLLDLAKKFHSYYSKGSKDAKKRIMIDNNEDLMLARLGLVKVVKKVIFNGLLILNINAPQKM